MITFGLIKKMERALKKWCKTNKIDLFDLFLRIDEESKEIEIYGRGMSGMELIEIIDYA